VIVQREIDLDEAVRAVAERLSDQP